MTIEGPAPISIFMCMSHQPHKQLPSALANRHKFSLASLEPRKSDSKDIRNLLFFFLCWNRKFLSSVFIAQRSWMFMTGVIYKILEEDTVSRCHDPAFCSPILQVLLSGISVYLYYVQTVLLLWLESFSFPIRFSCCSAGVLKVTEEVGSHGEEWCFEIWRPSFTMNAYKFRCV